MRPDGRRLRRHAEKEGDVDKVIVAILAIAVFIVGAICAVALFLTAGTAYGCYAALKNYAKAFMNHVAFEKPPGKP
jgi:uncharacterized membrane protein